jgi:hypothetical protein
MDGWNRWGENRCPHSRHFPRTALTCVAFVVLSLGCATKKTTTNSQRESALVESSAHPNPGAEAMRESVPSVNLQNLNPSAFADEELDLPYYLAHFSTLANSVEIWGTNRGFIKLRVWRGKAAAPHNARVMENVLSLVWFYTQKRDWNPYYAAPALRTRIEAALQFWTASQGSDGQFAEYQPGVFGLAPTAFATKFFGEALILLRSGPPLDRDVLASAEASLVKAVRATLTLPALYTTGRSFSNQFGNVWGGGLALLSFHRDDALRALWEQRFISSRTDFQSPAGFYYEDDGPDFEYTLHTHRHNLRQAWEWLRGTPLGRELAERESAWIDWLALNAVPEPGGGFTLNAAIATRKTLTSFHRYDTPIAEMVPLMRAFAESVEELAARRKAERSHWVETWPRVPPLLDGEASAYSPYTFLHRRLQEWRPSTAERDAARAALPVLARERFTVQRLDSRKDATFSFVRRPGYYATFTSGERAGEPQRYGIGLIWSPRLGTVLMSQPASDRGSWGTLSSTAKVFEAGSLNGEFSLDNVVIAARQPGNYELPPGKLESRYALGTSGRKWVTFDERTIAVRVKHTGDFEELLPLLVPADGKVSSEPGIVTMTTPRGRLLVRFSTQGTASVEPQPSSVLDKKLVVVRLPGRNTLTYSLTLQ